MARCSASVTPVSRLTFVLWVRLRPDDLQTAQWESLALRSNAVAVKHEQVHTPGMRLVPTYLHLDLRLVKVDWALREGCCKAGHGSGLHKSE